MGVVESFGGLWGLGFNLGIGASGVEGFGLRAMRNSQITPEKLTTLQNSNIEVPDIYALPQKPGY